MCALTPTTSPKTKTKKDPNRCERGYVGNTIGQANAVSDRLLDLRKCSYKGANLSGKTLSGALMSDADLSETNLQEAVLTKVCSLVVVVCVCGEARLESSCPTHSSTTPRRRPPNKNKQTKQNKTNKTKQNSQTKLKGVRRQRRPVARRPHQRRRRPRRL